MPPDRGATRKPAPPDKDASKKSSSVRSQSKKQDVTKERKETHSRDRRKEEQRTTSERVSKSRDVSTVRVSDNRTQQKPVLRKGEDAPVRKRESSKSDSTYKEKYEHRSTSNAANVKSSRDIKNVNNVPKEIAVKNRNTEKRAEKHVASPRQVSKSTVEVSKKTSVKSSSTSSPSPYSKEQLKSTAASYKDVNYKKLGNTENNKPSTSSKTSSSLLKKTTVSNTSDSKKISTAGSITEHSKVSERHSRIIEKENTSHEKGQPERLSRDRTRTRTLSPREVKVIKDPDRFNKQKIKDEIEKFLNTPSTSSATPPMLKYMAVSGDFQEYENKSSVQMSKNVTEYENQHLEDEFDYEYEDDFEDYESDFEECTDSEESGGSIASARSNTTTATQNVSTEPPSQQTKPSVEDEKKMDSGSYDLAETQRKNKQIQELKWAVEQENASIVQKQKDLSIKKVELALEDEGFEDETIEDTKPVKMNLKQSSINFASARKTRLQQQMQKKKRKRGEQLMKMIQFDTISFSLLDLPPIPYDIYMRCYGKCNSVQESVQTNEDNLSEEIQTEEITMKSKWTQNPVCFHPVKRMDGQTDEMQLYSQEYKGVGSDETEENPDAWKSFLKVDTVRLSRFLQSAGKAVLVLLEESLLHKSDMLKGNPQLPFSDGFVSLSAKSVDCLDSMSVTLIKFPPEHATTLLTVHHGKDQDNKLCVWSLMEPSRPHMVLSCSGEVSATCFDSHARVILAGLSDGTVCLWDLKEDSAHHMTGFRSPTYNAAHFLNREGHFHPIVAIEPATFKDDSALKVISSEVSPTQVCSLDVSGVIVIWTIIHSSRPELLPTTTSQIDLGLAYWGRIKLIQSSVISINDSLASFPFCSDAEYLSLGVDGKDHLFVGSTSGHIVHCLRTGMKPHPKLYLPSDGSCSYASCVAVCPFGEPFFLVGCSDGSIKLYWHSSEKMVGRTPGGNSPLKCVQWLYHSPCTVFSLDCTSRIQVWDLSKSDVSPLHSFLCEKSAASLIVSPRQLNGREVPTLVLSFEDGSVEIHQLKKEFWSHSENEFRERINSFLKYAGIL